MMVNSSISEFVRSPLRLVSDIKLVVVSGCQGWCRTRILSRAPICNHRLTTLVPEVSHKPRCEVYLLKSMQGRKVSSYFG